MLQSVLCRRVWCNEGFCHRSIGSSPVSLFKGSSILNTLSWPILSKVKELKGQSQSSSQRASVFIEIAVVLTALSITMALFFGLVPKIVKRQGATESIRALANLRDPLLIAKLPVKAQPLQLRLSKSSQLLRSTQRF